MRIVHFSTKDIEGGAAKAAHRIHTSLHNRGLDSKMYVLKKKSDDPAVFSVTRNHSLHSRYVNSGLRVLHWYLNSWIDRKKVAPHFFSQFGIPSLSVQELVQDADIVHLHWIAQYLADSHIHHIATSGNCRPVVWTLMDLAPLTGGCHYTSGCQRYSRSCGKCPLINSGFPFDISWLIMQRKIRHFRDIDLTFVAPTYWVRDYVCNSRFYTGDNVVVIPLGIDQDVFTNGDQTRARTALNLPLDKFIVFFGATYHDHERKGFRYLVEALECFHSMQQQGQPLSRDVVLVVAGNRSSEQSDLPLPTINLGHLNTDSALSLVYQAADLFLCPSIEDAGPMMIPEAMMCGTPVVAFNTGGAPDLITTMKTGYLAEVKNSFDLASGLYQLLLDPKRLKGMRSDCRNLATREHSLEVQARRYEDLYRGLLNRRQGDSS